MEKHEVGRNGEELVADLLRQLRFHVERPRRAYDSGDSLNASVDWLASKGNVKYAVEVKSTGSLDGTFTIRAGALRHGMKEHSDRTPALFLVTPREVWFFSLRRWWPLPEGSE